MTEWNNKSINVSWNLFTHHQFGDSDQWNPFQLKLLRISTKFPILIFFFVWFYIYFFQWKRQKNYLICSLVLMFFRSNSYDDAPRSNSSLTKTKLALIYFVSFTHQYKYTLAASVSCCVVLNIHRVCGGTEMCTRVHKNGSFNTHVSIIVYTDVHIRRQCHNI